MKVIWLSFFTIMFSCTQLKADVYEGVDLFRGSEMDLAILVPFMPYNPIIIEAGVRYGKEVCETAKIWPNGQIIAFEPNPYAYNILEKNIAGICNIKTENLALNSYSGTDILRICHGMKGADPAFDYASSLLPLAKGMEVYCQGPKLEVPCITLDEYCNANQITHVDILKLELGGLELPVLKNSKKILKNTKIVFLQTFIHPHRLGMTHFYDLKLFLEGSGFVLLSHRYVQGINGRAIFLSRELFDAFFKLSLGIYLGN